MARSRVFAFILTALALALPTSAFGHDIPNDVVVYAFVKPEGTRLRLLVRAPLEALRDIDVPQRDGGYIDLSRADRWFRDAARLWISENTVLFEEDVSLQTPRIVTVVASLPSDRSFESYETALAHVTGPSLPPETNIYWNQGMLDVLFEYAIRSDRSRFSIHPALATLGQQVTTVLHFLPPDAPERVFALHGDPGVVRLDPRWHQAVMQFVEMGFLHIFDGIDHLLFLLCLIVPTRRLLSLAVVVTSFTLAHSITLIASAYGVAPEGQWFPPLVETLIAMSIVYMAVENIITVHPKRRWAITFAFGLVHGFGFSFALRDTLQFAGSHLLTSLVSFNVGVELGQLLVLGLFAVALEVLFRIGIAETAGRIVVSALVAHTGWHWMVERAGQLAQFPWPALDLALLADALRWLLAGLIAVGLFWVVQLLRRSGRPAAHENTASVSAPARVQE